MRAAFGTLASRRPSRGRGRLPAGLADPWFAERLFDCTPEYLQTHYDQPLGLERLARLAEMPARRFQRLVKRVFHLTPGQLLLKAHLDAAADLLLESERTIVDIAGACGYSDHSAFTRQFKATVGLTPRQFRSASEEPPRGRSTIEERRRRRARD